MKKTIQIIVLAALCLNFTAQAQQPAKPTPPKNSYTGKVIASSNGEVLPGAIIKITPSNQTLVTNDRGEFSLNLSDGSYDLSVHYLNYTTKTVSVKIPLATPLIISLDADEQTLQEVEINAGYYTVKERERTGNISKITGATIEKNPVNNVLQALQGRVAGLQITQNTGVPGGAFSVQIRGKSSINNGNDPLYVIDGVIYPSTKLSAAIPGTINAGGNLLSLINPNDIQSIEVLKDADATAIYGSKGANGVILITTKKSANGQLKIDAAISQGISRVADQVELLNTAEYLQMRNEAFKNDGVAPAATQYDINGTWDPNKYTNWQELLIGGTAKLTNASVNVMGGSNNASYTLGGNYYQEGTVYPGSFGFRRGGLHSGINLGSANSRLKASFTGNYNHTLINLFNTDVTQLIYLSPNAPDPYDEYGDLNWANKTLYLNPMAYLLQTSDDKSGNLIANVNLSYRIIENLSLKTSVGYNSIQREQITNRPQASRSPAFSLSPNDRIAHFSDHYNNSWIAEPQLSYKAKLGPGNFDSILGLSFQEASTQLRTIKASGYSSDELMGNIASAPLLSILESKVTQYRYTAAFARFNYSIRDRYYLNITGRRDGSSRFGSGRQFANFGAVGAAWIFSEESIIKGILPGLSFGKLRASYGTTGNDQIPDYGYLQLWNSTTSGIYQGASTLAPNRIANDDYAWETNKKIEAAIQLGFLGSKLNVEISHYRNRSSNQLVGFPLPPSVGASSVQYNLPAIVQNTGWEFEANLDIVSSKPWQWSTAFNFTVPKNKLISYPGLETSNNATNYIVGQPLAIQQIYKTSVDPQTGLYVFEDIDENGTIDDRDRQLSKFVGQYYYGGWQNSIRFKAVALDFLFAFNKQNGNNYLSGTGMPGRWLFTSPVGNQLKEVHKRWQQSGDASEIQRFSTLSSSNLTYNNATSLGGISISDASFLRLKNVALSYRAPANWISQLGLSALSVQLLAQNVFTISNFIGLDPETQSMVNLPPLQTFQLGLNITF